MLYVSWLCVVFFGGGVKNSVIIQLFIRSLHLEILNVKPLSSYPEQEK